MPCRGHALYNDILYKEIFQNIAFCGAFFRNKTCVKRLALMTGHMPLVIDLIPQYITDTRTSDEPSSSIID